MKILAFLFLFLPAIVQAQTDYSSPALSDSIAIAMDSLGYDTLMQLAPGQAFWDLNDSLFVYITQISGGQFVGLSHTGPQVFKFGDTRNRRAWHPYEIDNWLAGTTGSKYEGYVSSDFGTVTTTITVSGDTWQSTEDKEADAFAHAFYKFLIDPNFATYLP